VTQTHILLGGLRGMVTPLLSSGGAKLPDVPGTPLPCSA
jgi:hypothetical protein